LLDPDYNSAARVYAIRQGLLTVFHIKTHCSQLKSQWWVGEKMSLSNSLVCWGQGGMMRLFTDEGMRSVTVVDVSMAP
jgi:hypothetical protein